MEQEQHNVTLEAHEIKDLYQGVRGLAIKILNRIDRTDAYLERMLDSEMKSAELKGQDKALLYEIVHGVVRWQGRLDWILNGFYKGTFSKAIPNLKNALRVALYQILFLDRVPDYAAVNEVVEFVKRLQGQKPADLVNAVLRNIIRSKNAIRYPEPDEDLIGYLAAYYSHPSWLVKRYVQRFGREETEQLLFTNNEKPFLTLRINALKTKPDEFKQLLEAVNLKYRQGAYLPEFFKLQNLTNITAWEFYGKGYFNIQDESAGLACRLLDVQEGFRILDMCAAPGGKTAYIAALIHSRGEVVALDRFESRLRLLQKNMERLEVDCVRIVAIDALEYTSLPFDRILVDVPCSGTGTLSKKPDIKWRRDIFDIRDLNKMQLNLLTKAATLVKTDGALVYSTCSIEPEENFEIVKQFLSAHTNFKFESAKDKFPDEIIDENGCIQTLPQKHKMDGAFAAKLVRVS
ncbi:MAG: 16S rRNA (cytosine(967)-C(5))-methyltransferase RsmB [Ignavibacteria bacterium]|nr:16S rRNA (cytosine(967)-C(5))-methyltransferase RsmB [Ignavibacteria bacterium]MBT8383258.1 16S rRNA (cytosine(967)-C(5))-methyltransferase RsmB [Ignavibacteria bacterium]MBT8390363.1 16S rRNA (cytosine(967)-C(5))-methyltransferase RsmB [Ignavibacteria bacterium]NNJ53377.1 16S rRNA (cytosine(967)-C(5))-methyltransferase RsmB [Ignavibacteriaceae bacterium]NNL21608.1 16S rRNA (cytosine(967)-C(5))-methyltransferase RsmB [Ignavibacteriaceae bacterium]